MKDAKGHGSNKRGGSDPKSPSGVPLSHFGKPISEMTGAHSAGINNVGRTPDINHPVYNTNEKAPGWTRQVSPLNADYTTGGRILRNRLGSMSKDQHVAAGEDHFKQAAALGTAYGKAADTAAYRLGGRDPGPLISGVISDKYAEHDKNLLRDLATQKNAHTSAGFAHYAAAGKRIDTARARYQFHKGK